MAKSLVILVPGAKYIKSRSPVMKHIILWFYRVSKIFTPIYIDTGDLWTRELRRKRPDLVVGNWPGDITTLSRWIGARKIIKMIDKNAGKDIILVGISLGGDVARVVAHKRDVKKVILVCSMNRRTRVKTKKTEWVNIYSPDDKLLDVGLRMLAPLRGGMRIRGKNVTNIELPEFTHDKFCNNGNIASGQYRGKKITAVVKSFL